MALRDEWGIFRIVWEKKHKDLKQWGFSNIILGLLPVWLSWLAYILSSCFSKFLDPFINGSILIFCVTLTCSSMAFFAENTNKELVDSRRFLSNWMISLVVIASAAFAIIVILPEVAPQKCSPVMICLVSAILFFASLLLNFHFAALRLAYSDEELIQYLLNRETSDMAKQAERAKQVNGTRL